MNIWFFHFLPVVNNLWTFTYKFLCGNMFSIILSTVSRTGICGSHSNSVFKSIFHFGKVSFIFFFFFWLHWVFAAAHGLSLVAASRGHSPVMEHRFLIVVRAVCGAGALGHMGFLSCSSWALGHRLSSCRTQAELPWGMREIPGARIKPVSPALQGGF